MEIKEGTQVIGFVKSPNELVQKSVGVFAVCLVNGQLVLRLQRLFEQIDIPSVIAHKYDVKEEEPVSREIFNDLVACVLNALWTDEFVENEQTVWSLISEGKIKKPTVTLTKFEQLEVNCHEIFGEGVFGYEN